MSALSCKDTRRKADSDSDIDSVNVSPSLSDVLQQCQS